MSNRAWKRRRSPAWRRDRHHWALILKVTPELILSLRHMTAVHEALHMQGDCRCGTSPERMWWAVGQVERYVNPESYVLVK